MGIYIYVLSSRHLRVEIPQSIAAWAGMGVGLVVCRGSPGDTKAGELSLRELSFVRSGFENCDLAKEFNDLLLPLISSGCRFRSAWGMCPSLQTTLHNILFLELILRGMGGIPFLGGFGRISELGEKYGFC